MNLKHVLKAAFLTALMTALPVLAASPEVGQPAPAFSGTNAEGKTVNLAEFKGKTVVLEWTNHDCPFVKKHYESGNMQGVQKDATAKGIIWLQVISSAPGQQGQVDGATAKRLNSERGASVSGTILDPEGKIGRAYAAQTTPHMYIINPAGVLVYKGGIDSIPSTKKEDLAKAENYVRAALGDLATGRPVANPSTRPYGCGVKYGS